MRLSKCYNTDGRRMRAMKQHFKELHQSLLRVDCPDSLIRQTEKECNATREAVRVYEQEKFSVGARRIGDGFGLPFRLSGGRADCDGRCGRKLHFVVCKILNIYSSRLFAAFS